MGEMTIRNIDDALLVELARLAELQGNEPSELARDLVTFCLRGALPNGLPGARPLNAEERARQDELVQDLRDIRAMTLKPLSFDSTLLIREMRDADG